jgi:hypothetical protein
MVAVAALVALFALYKLRPRARARSAVAANLGAARKRAAAAKTPRERAVAFVDAGQTAASARRYRAAAGLFLRAMRADPAHADAVTQASAALASRRPHILEGMLWRRLEQTTWDGPHAASLRACALALAALYEGKLRNRGRGVVLRRLADRLP